ncbi:zinc ABC transporter substrate-binding protein [Candidatus Saccharibacteria bacterium]|nr:zinc ABC transporter substrate-binding protein [Candidatus Saccharibacteria bacterium]
MKNIKKFIALIIFFILILAATVFMVIKINERRNNQARASIISTSFVGYDFARAVNGDNNGIKMLLKPGAESHDYEPSPQDIIDIEKADLFIYVGGESEAWVEKILHDNNIDKSKTLRLMDLVELKEEETVEGMEETSHEHEHKEETEHEEGEHSGEHEEETEYDEHIWTSPKNAIKLVEAIQVKMIQRKPTESDKYTENTARYTAKISELDAKFREIVASSPKKELIFGDRFPFRYFVDEYELKYYAAFPGCAEQAEASSNTVAFLIDKIKQDDIQVVLKIELTAGNLAKTIAEETGAKVMELNSAHNVSAEDFERGVTYVDIMTENTEVLAEALK